VRPEDEKRLPLLGAAVVDLAFSRRDRIDHRPEGGALLIVAAPDRPTPLMLSFAQAQQPRRA
jgi:hypothetical protein